VIVMTRRAGLPHGRALLGAVVYGTLTFGASFASIYRGLVRVPAGLAATLLATAPLLTFVLALVQRQERFRWDGLLGGVIAMVGVAMIFWAGADVGVPVASLLAILAGTVCLSEAGIVVKAFPPSHPAVMNGMGMALGGVILLALSAVFGEAHIVPSEEQTWLAQAYLVTLGSVGVFALYLFVLRGWTASAVSYQFVLMPVVTVLLSAWLQDERITWAFAAGAILVLIGIYYGALRRPRRARTQAPVQPTA
jgi:drug/metabolite transporter (DMT)-like permease